MAARKHVLVKKHVLFPRSEPACVAQTARQAAALAEGLSWVQPRSPRQSLRAILLPHYFANMYLNALGDRLRERQKHALPSLSSQNTSSYKG